MNTDSWEKIAVRKTELDLDKTLCLGQAFRWKKTADGIWYCALFGRLVALKQVEDGILINGEWTEDIKNYLDLGTNYEEIVAGLGLDEITARYYKRAAGIHILRQDLVEASLTFILSTANNMKRISGMVNRLCYELGDKVEFEGLEGYTFPSISKILENIRSIFDMGFGFRAENFVNLAACIDRFGENALVRMNSEDLYKWLLRVKGIGPKVASCILLFGKHDLNAFPVDVHLKNVLMVKYGGTFDMKRYEPYNGLIQQYLFYGDTVGKE